MTDFWSHRWEHFVCIEDDKQIPVKEFQKQRKIAELSPEAKQIISWFEKRERADRKVSLVELTKCLTPICLRKAILIRHIMRELVAVGLAKIHHRPTYYSGHQRRQCWEFFPNKD